MRSAPELSRPLAVPLRALAVLVATVALARAAAAEPAPRDASVREARPWAVGASWELLVISTGPPSQNYGFEFDSLTLSRTILRRLELEVRGGVETVDHGAWLLGGSLRAAPLLFGRRDQHAILIGVTAALEHSMGADESLGAIEAGYGLRLAGGFDLVAILARGEVLHDGHPVVSCPPTTADCGGGNEQGRSILTIRLGAGFAF